MAPDSGPPRSSLTVPRMLPSEIPAFWFVAMNLGSVWAYTAAVVVPTTMIVVDDPAQVSHGLLRSGP